MRQHPCDYCGETLTLSAGDILDATSLRWCDDVCADAWTAEDPKRSEGWVSVSDATPTQREALDALLGHTH